MNTETNKPTPDSDNSAATMLRKFAAVLCYVLAALGALMLLKTELRKWFDMGGDPTPANTLFFWISLGWAAAFWFAGSILWPKKRRKSGRGAWVGGVLEPAFSLALSFPARIRRVSGLLCKLIFV